MIGGKPGLVKSCLATTRTVRLLKQDEKETEISKRSTERQYDGEERRRSRLCLHEQGNPGQIWRIRVLSRSDFLSRMTCTLARALT